MLKISFNHILPTILILFILIGIIFLLIHCKRWDNSKHKNLFFLINLVTALLILLMIFKPEVKMRTPFRRKEKIAVMLDVSLSMSVPDENQKNRLDEAKDFIKKDKVFKDYDITFYTAGEKLTKLEEEKLDTLTPKETSSLLLSAINELQNKMGKAYKKIILFSDGQESRLEDMLVLQQSGNIPVYTLGMGGGSFKDISISSITTNSPIYVGETLQVEAYLHQQGFDNQRKKVILKENGKTLKEKEIFFLSPTQSVLFEVIPATQGDKIYEVEVIPDNLDIIKENNRMFFASRVISPKINILFVEGNLRWEYKYLKRYIEGNSRLSPTFFIRVGENIFQYSDVENPTSPVDIFSDAHFLEKFNIIIFGEIDFSSLTSQQMKNIKSFCEIKGRNILFLGGKNFLKGTRNTEIEGLLPLILSGEEESVMEDRFLPFLSEESKTLPIFSGGEERLPYIMRANSVYNLKEGAVPLIIAEKERKPIILSGVKITNEGGKSAFIGTDDTWRWVFGNEKEKNAYKFLWGRLIRFLWTPEDSLGLGKRVPYILVDKKICSIGEKIGVSFNYLDNKEGTFEVTLKTPENKIENLDIKEMKTFFTPTTEGIYTIETKAEGKRNISEVFVRKEGDEFIDIGRNENFLKQISELSKGRYLPFEEKNKLKDILKKEDNYIRTNFTFSHNIRKYIILFIFIILNFGWHLRRQNG